MTHHSLPWPEPENGPDGYIEAHYPDEGRHETRRYTATPDGNRVLDSVARESWWRYGLRLLRERWRS